MKYQCLFSGQNKNIFQNFAECFPSMLSDIMFSYFISIALSPIAEVHKFIFYLLFIYLFLFFAYRILNRLID